LSKDRSADRVEEEVDRVAGDEEHPGAVLGNDDRLVRYVDDVGEGQLEDDEVREDRNVKDDVGRRHEDEHDG